MAHSRAASTRASPPRSARPSTNPTANRPVKPGAASPNQANALAQTGRADGRQRARRAGLYWAPPVLASNCPPDSLPSSAVRRELPRQHRKKLRSTNPIERLNKEVKRRADGVGVRRENDSLDRFLLRLTPQRGFHHPPHRRCAVRAERRMTDRKPLHSGRGLRPDRPRGDRPHSQHNNSSPLIMTSGHPGIYTNVTDVTSVGGLPGS